jgi:hypothetical protein
VLRESGAPDHKPMSNEARAGVEALARTLRETLGIG